ncbi:MAG TPA: DUF4270 family protein [Bacteroidales bacterium]|nr:DUF4270 family protein [Bacteroidales bacterium]HQB21263.1 DUF4270 family protein [Bacteroidales bacterium]
MQIYNKCLCFFTIIVISIFLFNSCEKKQSNIGLDLIPDSDKLHLYADTIDVNCYTVTDSIVSSDERTLSPLGSYIDPIFGFTKSSFVCHARISSSNVDFSTVSKINSIELHLKYSTTYGDTSTNQTVKVCRLKKEIYFDNDYYSNFTLQPSEYEVLTSETLRFRQDSLAKIKLPDELAQEFINADKTNFINNTTFIEFFNGLYVYTDSVSSDGCIYSINLIHPDSKMVMYYNDSLQYDFLINSKSAIINMFEQDYTNANSDITNVLADSTLLLDNCYIQSLAGLKAKIYFPQIIDYFDTIKNVAINKAQLVITLKLNTDENVFLPPPKLALVAITEDGKYDFLTDYKLNNSNFGGTLENKITYKFNIPFHIQELVNGKTDTGIYLFANDNRTIPYRVVLNANGASEDRMKLEVYYSLY